jgi:hypothetical protein
LDNRNIERNTESGPEPKLAENVPTKRERRYDEGQSANKNSDIGTIDGHKLRAPNY